MNASYELVVDDVVAFSQFHNTQSPAARKYLFGCLGLAFIAMLPLPSLVFLTSDQPFLKTAQDIWPLLWPLLLFPVFAAVLVPFIRWSTRRLAKRMLDEGDNSGYYGLCSISLDESGILETKVTGDSHRKWTAVQRIVVTTDHVFVYTSAVEAFVIPRRAFDGESDFVAFVTYLRDHSSAELLNV